MKTHESLLDEARTMRLYAMPVKGTGGALCAAMVCDDTGVLFTGAMSAADVARLASQIPVYILTRTNRAES